MSERPIRTSRPKSKRPPARGGSNLRRPFKPRNSARPRREIKPIDIWRNVTNVTLSCPTQVGPILSQELAQLGYTVSGMNEQGTMVGVEGLTGVRDLFKLNLMVRTANRVLIPVGDGPARDLEGLYRAALQIPWEAYLDPDRPFLVNSSVSNLTVRDSRMPNLKTKDAIADRMRKHCGRRPDSGDRNLFDGACIYVYWEGSYAKFYLDTTGRPLIKRGYRKADWRSNISEGTAAAALIAGGWNAQTSLVVPMCGSGTLAIEAALMAKHRAPGILRSSYALMALKGYETIIPGENAEVGTRRRFGASPAQIWRQVLHQVQEAEKRENLPLIIATDRSHEAVEAARKNAIVAGVATDIIFDVCDFAETQLPETKGTIVLNPDYGERPAGAIELAPLYRRIGDWLKAQPGWAANVLLTNLELAKEIGLRTSHRIQLYNGAQECRLLVFDLYEGSREP